MLSSSLLVAVAAAAAAAAAAVVVVWRSSQCAESVWPWRKSCQSAAAQRPPSPAPWARACGVQSMRASHHSTTKINRAVRSNRETESLGAA